MSDIVITAKDGTGLTGNELIAYLKKTYAPLIKHAKKTSDNIAASMGKNAGECNKNYKNKIYSSGGFTAVDDYLNCEVSYSNGEFELGVYEDDES